MKRMMMILAMSLFAIVGCSTKEYLTASLSKTDKSLVWHHERTKGFGNYDYPTLKKAEAEKLLKDKFQLEIPTLYNEIQPIIEKKLVENGAKETSPIYQMYVQPTQVVFTKIIPFEKNNQPYIDAKIELKYFFDDGNKLVKLNNQTIMLINKTNQSSTLEDEVPAFANKVGEKIDLGALEQGLSNYESKVQESKGLIKLQTITISDNSKEAKKEKGLLKSIQVAYDEQGVLRELYGNLIDITE